MIRLVNVTWVDLVSLTVVRSQTARWSRCCWRLWVGRYGSGLLASMAVSCTNVAMMVSCLVGISAVKRRYNRGPSTLHWGTPACIGKTLEVDALNFIWEYCSVRYDLRRR